MLPLGTAAAWTSQIVAAAKVTPSAILGQPFRHPLAARHPGQGLLNHSLCMPWSIHAPFGVEGNPKLPFIAEGPLALYDCPVDATQNGIHMLHSFPACTGAAPTGYSSTITLWFPDS